MSNNRELDFSLVIKLSREIYFKNFRWILLASAGCVCLLPATIYSFAEYSRSLPSFICLFLIHPLSLIIFGTVMCFCMIDRNIQKLKKLLRIRIYPIPLLLTVCSFGVLFMQESMFVLMLLLFLINSLIPVGVLLFSFYFLRIGFLSLDQCKPIKEIYSIYSIVKTDNNEPMFKRNDIPKYPAILNFNIKRFLLFSFISLAAFLYATFELNLLRIMTMLQTIVYHSISWLSILFFFMSMYYILLIDVEIYRIRIAQYVKDMTSLAELEKEGYI